MGYWQAHGLASKWVLYTDEETQEVVIADKAAVAPEVKGTHYGTTDLAVCIIRGKLGKDYENRVANAAALGYTADEVRAAQDLVNVVVAKANEEKAEAETCGSVTQAFAIYSILTWFTAWHSTLGSLSL